MRPRDGEMWLVGAHIAPYEAANQYNHDPKRDRKLLLHRREIERLAEAFDQKSLTIVPLHLYIARGLAKLEIGVGRGGGTMTSATHSPPATRIGRCGPPCVADDGTARAGAVD